MTTGIAAMTPTVASWLHDRDPSKKGFAEMMIAAIDHTGARYFVRMSANLVGMSRSKDQAKTFRMGAKPSPASETHVATMNESPNSRIRMGLPVKKAIRSMG